jgi:hypothetical protein
MLWTSADVAVLPSVPSRDLLSQIFPFIESAQAELHDHVCKSSLSTDIALKQFLSVLAWFQTVLLQDGAVLYAGILSSWYSSFTLSILHNFVPSPTSRSSRWLVQRRPPASPSRTYHSILSRACKGLSPTCLSSSKHSELRTRPFVLRCGSMSQHRMCCLLSSPGGQRAREPRAEERHKVCSMCGTNIRVALD